MTPPSNTPPVEVSTLRLYLLRATYLLIAAGLTLTIWPLILRHPADVPHMNGVVRSVLGAVALLAVAGIHYPLKMLPLLLFELVWKVRLLVCHAGEIYNPHRACYGRGIGQG